MSNTIWVTLCGWWDRQKQTEAEDEIKRLGIPYKWGDYATHNGKPSRELIILGSDDDWMMSRLTL